jgi:hypothetical protein
MSYDFRIRQLNLEVDLPDTRDLHFPLIKPDIDTRIASMSDKTDSLEGQDAPSPSSRSRENLHQPEASTSAPVDGSPPYDGQSSPHISLSTLVGPTGAVGFQFAHSHGHESPIEDVNARVRKKFKRVVSNCVCEY